MKNLYFNYKDELYHYGVKGMKWGEHIFGEDLTKLGDRIGAAADRLQQKNGGNPSSNIKTFGQWKSSRVTASNKAGSKGSSGKPTVVNKLTQDQINELKERVKNGGTTKAAKGKGGSGKKGGSGSSKGTSEKAQKVTKEEVKKVIEEIPGLSKRTGMDSNTTAYLKKAISGMSLTEVARRAINGEFGDQYNFEELLGDRYEEFKKVLSEVLSGKITEDDDESVKAASNAVKKGEEYLKRMYANISLSKK